MPNIKAKQLAPPAPASPALNLAQAVQIGKLSWVNTPSVVGTYADSATPTSNSTTFWSRTASTPSMISSAL